MKTRHSTPATRHSFKERYSFWEDRTVGDYVYRFDDYEIKRRPVNGTLFVTHLESDDRSVITAEWIKICDQAIAEKEAA